MLPRKAHLSLEVEYADADLALGVVAGGGEGARVAQHGGAAHRHAEHAAVLGANSIALKKGPKKRPEKGTESQFAKNICMNFFDWVEFQ